MKRVLAVIPARGGSKSIPMKNITELAGKPLIAWTIHAAQQSHCVSDTIVSSDSDLILDIAEKYGAKRYKRSKILSQDTVKTVPVVIDVINNIEQKYEYIVLLQATSPLREDHHIDDSFEKMILNKSEAIISVVEPNHSPLKAFFSDKNENLKGIINNEYPFMPRQSLPKTYYPNGAIYFVKTSSFLKENSFFIKDSTTYYTMKSSSSVDVDSHKDLKYAERIIEERNIR